MGCKSAPISARSPGYEPHSWSNFRHIAARSRLQTKTQTGSYYCGAPASHSAPPVGHPGVRCQSDRDTFHCEGGARVDLQRTVELERIR